MSADPSRRRPGQVAGAFVAGALIGAAAGAALVASSSVPVAWGAIVGAVGVGGSLE